MVGAAFQSGGLHRMVIFLQSVGSSKLWLLSSVQAGVFKSEDYTVPLSDFVKNFVDLMHDAVSLYNLPSPSAIISLSSC